MIGLGYQKPCLAFDIKSFLLTTQLPGVMNVAGVLNVQDLLICPAEVLSLPCLAGYARAPEVPLEWSLSQGEPDSTTIPDQVFLSLGIIV
jgi:hypothetical protein